MEVSKIQTFGKKGIGSMGRMRLEEYNVAIQDFHDALRGLDTAIEEALLRCDRARLVCGEARLLYDRETAERASSRSLQICPERQAIEERYLLAVIAYGDALSAIQLRPRIPNDDERQRIEQARSVCNSAFIALQDHVRTHRCRKGAKTISA
jgi:hypothetical protein